MHVVAVGGCEPDVVGRIGGIQVIDECTISIAGGATVEHVSGWSSLTVASERSSYTTVPCTSVSYPWKVISTARASILAEHCRSEPRRFQLVRNICLALARTGGSWTPAVGDRLLSR